VDNIKEDRRYRGKNTPTNTSKIVRKNTKDNTINRKKMLIKADKNVDINDKKYNKDSKNKKYNKDKKEDKYKLIKKDKLIKNGRKSKIIKSKAQKVNDNSIRYIFTKDGVKTTTIIIFIAFMLMLVVYRYTKISNLRYSINEATKRVEEIEKEIKVEKTKIDEASRSDIIEEKAKKDLGLVHIKPNQKEYITVE
jgi:hypothetical protein